MAYIRKTKDRWDIETNSGYGWDIEYSAYSWKEARRVYREYLENSCGRYSVRITKRREAVV